MAETTKIEWCDATFNPWIGCTKVSPGCDHCYAEATMDTRYGKVHWGAGQPRVRTGEKNWNLPKRWNKEPFFECPECGLRGDCRAMGDEPKTCKHFHAELTRRRVFCSSLADVFDNEVDPAWRADLFELIRATPNLDWLLLTKRIGNAERMIEQALIAQGDGATDAMGSWPWPNVWLGATVVNQEEADRDIPKLLAVPARVRFLSIEPMLGPIYLRSLHVGVDHGLRGVSPKHDHVDPLRLRHAGIHWVICGGESGPGARPMHPDWAKFIRDQCADAGVPFLFKQWGEWAPYDDALALTTNKIATHEDLKKPMLWLGKKTAGRLLDGIEHNGFPQVSP